MREVEDAVQRAASSVKSESVTIGELTPDVLVPEFTWEPLFDLPLREAKRQFEREYILELLMRTRGNITKAAQLAGIARQNLHQKLKVYGIRGKEFK